MCHACRHPETFEPDERERRWVEKIPDERLDSLLDAVAAAR